MTVVQPTNLQPTSQIPDVYIVPLPPPPQPPIIDSDVVAIIGEFNRGPVDTLRWVGDLAADLVQFGTETDNPLLPGTPLSGVPAVTNVHNQGVLDKIVVRVLGSTGRSAHITLFASGAVPVLTLFAATPGAWAHGNLQIVVSSGVSGWNITATNLVTGETPLVLLNLPSGSTPAIAAAINTIRNAGSPLVTASLPVVADPVTPLTGSAATDTGTLPAGIYYATYTWITAAGGESGPAPESLAVTLSAPGHITWTAPSLPSGVSGIKIYLTAPGGAQCTETVAGSVSGASLSISALPSASTVQPPFQSTALLSSGTGTAVPVNGTFTFPASSPGSGASLGDNGANAGAARHTGVQAAVNTGLQTLATMTPVPNLFLFAEAAGTDTTQWLAQAQFAQANNSCAVVALPLGTAPTAAPSLLQTQTAALAAYGDNIKCAVFWAQVQDTLYNSLQYRSPASFLAAITATQPYNTAAYNKGLVGVYGVGQAPTRTQRDAIISAFGNALVQGLPSGVSLYGFDADYGLSGVNAFEIRARAFFIAALGPIMGPYVGQPNKPDNRQLATAQVTGVFDREAKNGMIPSNPAGGANGTGVTAVAATATPTTATSKASANTQPSAVQAASAAAATTQPGYVVICDTSNNVVNGVTTSDMNMLVEAQLFENTKRAVIQVAVGATVQVTAVASSAP